MSDTARHKWDGPPEVLLGTLTTRRWEFRLARWWVRRSIRRHAERLVYTSKRCPCGALYAYDPRKKPRPDAWDCSDIILGLAAPTGHPESVTHGDTMPFVFWRVKTVDRGWALANRTTW